jgi:hypothetical protein
MRVLAADISLYPSDLGLQFLYIKLEFFNPKTVQKQRFQSAPFHWRRVFFQGHFDFPHIDCFEAMARQPCVF